MTVVAATWAATVAPWLNWNDHTTLAVAMGVLTLAGIVTALVIERTGIQDSVLGVVGLVLLLVWALAVPQLRQNVQSIGFDAGVALVGVWLFVGLRSGRVAERAIELDESTGTLREALAELLYDPGLEVGFPATSGEFIDEDGRPGHRADLRPGIERPLLPAAGSLVGEEAGQVRRTYPLLAVSPSSCRKRIQARTSRS